jgi:error-prone DNA polymerase
MQYRYAELHCHSSYSFLDGVSSPEELVEEAARLGYAGLALTDHNGFYGVVQFAQAARRFSLPTVYGAELTLHLDEPLFLYPFASKRSLHFGFSASSSSPPFTGIPSPASPPSPSIQSLYRRGTCPSCGRYRAHIVVLAKNPLGYSALSRVITRGQLRGSKGHPLLMLSDLSSLDGDCVVLTGGCNESLHPLLLTEIFAPSDVFLEATNHLLPEDSAALAYIDQLARRHKLSVVATNVVHHSTKDQAVGAQIAAATRLGTTLEEAYRRGLANPSGERYLKPMSDLYELHDPAHISNAADLATALTFDLKIAQPSLPRFSTPTGESEASYLRSLVLERLKSKYPPHRYRAAREQAEHELAVIEALGYAGYFLIVWDIVEFCKKSNILCQGRGSAANSIVCYVLGITNADPLELDLLFERFLSPERDGPPDIDIDIEHHRREEVIQHIFLKYGRLRAAQVANVITYRQKLAFRDAAKAIGLKDGQIDTIASSLGGFFDTEVSEAAKAFGLREDTLNALVKACSDLADEPRHMGIHTGGIVLAESPLSDTCPIEWAQMEGRSVLQWDKDDCAYMGLVKFDLLGLGMLSCLHKCIDYIRLHRGHHIDLAKLPQEPEIYNTISEADTVGVFQIESRAQMDYLPRTRPQNFHDLIVQVALVRPGPIQGQSVHPYIRRRRGEEPVRYLHPLLKPALQQTLGVPIFQEQLMRIAMDAAGFTAEQADRLRQALSNKRSRERVAELYDELMHGMQKKGIDRQVAEQIFKALLGFADFGFPESHAASFAYLVYASAWLRYHYPAEYLAAILNSQPMGFYSHASLIMDAKRHGVRVLGPDVCESEYDCILTSRVPPTCTGKAVLLGLRYVRGLGYATANHIINARAQRPFRDFEDFLERTMLERDALEALALAGAFKSFGISPREALWKAGIKRSRPTRYSRRRLPAEDTAVLYPFPRLNERVTAPPALTQMSSLETTLAELWSVGAATKYHLVEHLRPSLGSLGIATIRETTSKAQSGKLARVVGLITHKQRPPTAGGALFLNLEDETGMLNVVVRKRVLEKYKKSIVSAKVALVEGKIQKRHGAVSLLAEKIVDLEIDGAPKSRDFR